MGMSMTVRMLINGVAADQVPALDRGLAYGDGLFESIRLVDAVAPLWSRHMQRLVESCERLRIPVPDAAQLWREVLEVTCGMPHSVARITVTRGIGERGYALPASPRPMRVVTAFAPPEVADSAYTQGVRMRVCDIRLAEQPLLAGMKHLNRLEQVLARAEWDDSAIVEGVLCDSHGRAISATMAGVARAEVLSAYPQAQVGELTLDALSGASEVFLSSSVRGILPVRSLGRQDYEVGEMTRQLQQHWRNLGFSMEHGG